MRCTDARVQITAYLDGELADEAGSAMRGHLRTCEACRVVARDEAALRDGLRDLPAVDPPASLWAGVQARLAAAEMADAERPAWRRRVARWLSVTRRAWPLPLAGLAVAAAAVLLVWHSHHTEVATAPVPVPMPMPVPASKPPIPADTVDITADLAAAPAHETDSYAQAAAELLQLAQEERARWSEDRKQAFDARIAELRKQIDGAHEGRDRQHAYRALIRYLQRAAVRDEVTLADVGGAR
jgi:hypothetical protein